MTIPGVSSIIHLSTKPAHLSLAEPPARSKAGLDSTFSPAASASEGSPWHSALLCPWPNPVFRALDGPQSCPYQGLTRLEVSRWWQDLESWRQEERTPESVGPLPSMPQFRCFRQPATASVDTWSFIILSPHPPQDDQSKHFWIQFPELFERWGVSRHVCTHTCTRIHRHAHRPHISSQCKPRISGLGLRPAPFLWQNSDCWERGNLSQNKSNNCAAGREAVWLSWSQIACRDWLSEGTE